ncbi:hypothetical protein MBLNU230_g4923t1 [Neophaeotheca triangularis]
MLSPSYRRAFAPRPSYSNSPQTADQSDITMDPEPAAQQPTRPTVSEQNMAEFETAIRNSYLPSTVPQHKIIAQSTSSIHMPPNKTGPRRPLDDLPSEIIALIAAETDADTILALAATNKFIRAASYDALVLRSMLSTTSARLFRTGAVDVDHIAAIAGSDPAVWARYAKALGPIEEVSKDLSPERYWQMLREYMAELLVVNFPLEVDRSWFSNICQVREQPLCRLLSLGMMLLSSNDVEKETRFQIAWNGGQPRCASYVETLWDLCFAISSLKWSLEKQGTHSETVIVKPLKAGQVRLRARDGSIQPPIPFSRLLSDPLSATSDAWESWFYKLTQINMSPESLSESKWSGCVIPPYETNGASHMALDPITITPITGDSHVQQGPNGKIYPFRIENPQMTNGDGSGEKTAWAEYSDVGICTGIVFRIHLASYPEYTETHWSCRVTPFGIVGTYGRPQPASFLRYHSYSRAKIWLWRKDWQGE